MAQSPIVYALQSELVLEGNSPRVFALQQEFDNWEEYIAPVAAGGGGSYTWVGG